MQNLSIGSLTLDFDRESVVNEAGDLINFRLQTYLVFIYLCRNRGRVVTKKELMDSVWAGSMVTDNSLVKCIAEIRKEIDDTCCIALKTITRRGYLLTETDANSSTELSTSSEVPTIAVLPFRSLSADADSLCAGLTEDVTTHLSSQRDIFVLASNSARHYSSELNNSIADLFDQLSVKYLLQGSVQKMDEVLRVNVQLSDVQSNTQLWSHRFTEEGGNLFKIQDELGAKIVNRLSGTAGVVLTVERAGLQREMPDNYEAHDMYVLATNVDKILSKKGNEEAIEQLKKVVELAPQFSRAWLHLASNYLLSASFAYTDDLPATIEAYIEAAMTAVELDPNDAMCQTQAGGAYCFLGQLTQAKKCFDRAISIGPNNADALALVAYIRPTKFDTAAKDLENIRRAKSLNPYFPMWYSLSHGYSAYYAREYKEAIDALEQVDVEILDAQLYLALCYAELGDDEKTEFHRANLLAIKPDFAASQIVEGDSMQIPALIEHFLGSAKKAGFPI